MEGERKSSVHAVKGPDADVNASVHELHERRFAQSRWWTNEERPKTREELRVIKDVVSGLNDFLQQYGAEPLAIKAQHIHILDRERLGEEIVAELDRSRERVGGVYVQHAQYVVIPGWRVASPVVFLQTLSHEIIHFISFNVSRSRSRESFPRSYRVGLSTHKREQEGFEASKEDRDYFEGLNEAITEELNIRFIRTLRKIGGMKVSVAPFSKDKSELAVSGTRKLKVPPGEPPYETEKKKFAYPEARRRLWKLIDEIYAQNTDSFSSNEEIFTIFAKAAMTGDVKEMAQLVERLGHGRFRDVARQSKM